MFLRSRKPKTMEGPDKANVVRKGRKGVGTLGAGDTIIIISFLGGPDHVYLSVYLSIYLSIYIYIYTYIQTYIHMCIYICTYMCVYVSSCICICICLCLGL